MPVMCGECTEELTAIAGSIPHGGIPVPTRVVPVQTVGLYRCVCSRGHSVVMIADFQQFELLFESAMEAFVDNYYREAVSSFVASLERFYEFAIQTLLLASGTKLETIDSMWDTVSNQSERQLGMYIGLYTQAYNRPPNVLSSNQSSFRNSVIHKGHFPSPQEVFKFADSVYNILNIGLKELRTDHHDAMQRARGIARDKAYAQVKPNEKPTQFGMGTTISLMVLDDPLPLKDELNKVAARMHRHRSADTGNSGPES